VRAIIAVVVLCVLGALGTGCSDDSSAPPGDTTTVAPPSGPSSSVGSASTEPETVDVCDALGTGLAEVGVDARPDRLTESGPTQCIFLGDTSTSFVGVLLTGNTDSAAYEEALADPDLGDPLTVDDVGEMAARATRGTQDVFVAFGSGVLIELAQLGVIDGDRLVEVGRYLMDLLT
jgi:hypothetical protein